MIKDKDTSRDSSGYTNSDNKSNYLLNKDNMSAEKTTIFNIRSHPKGLYFDLRIYSQNKDKTIKNLLIPQQIFKEKAYKFEKDDKERRILVFKYALIYFAAVVSIIVIVDGFMRIWPTLKNLFGI